MPANAGVWRAGGASLPRMLFGVSLALALLQPVAAHAISGQGLTVINKWKAMDACAVEAQRAFPEFTAQSNAQRDAKLKECLAQQNLPPREASPPAR